jgi:alanyl aminopeptidase
MAQKNRLQTWSSPLVTLLISTLACAYTSPAPPHLRLSEVQEVQPAFYKIALTLDPDSERFNGSIAIRLDVKAPLRTLWLNATNISVQKAVLEHAGTLIKPTVVPGGSDFLGFEFTSPLEQGPAEIRIDYMGAIQLGGQAGIFRTEDSGNRYLLTQFEATDARKAFPCFDEPFYKVPWQLTLLVPAKNIAISNSPPASESTSGRTKTYVFETTKPLPSYLVAFGVGPFEVLDAGTAGKNRVPVRVITPKGRANEGKYAAEVTSTILTRLEQYFGIPYPYAKADQVAIPISTGFAMENAGMVTYGQPFILAKPQLDSEARRRMYASIATHELAHQWFGDLVTTAWWDDIWLNEAFATWMANKLLAEWQPAWNTRGEEATQKLMAENSDSLVSARKIRQEIRSNGDIYNAFDNITYTKGASVIRMFESWMGEDIFQRGVRRFLTDFAFRTATTADFLHSLSAASQQDISTAFSTFLDQSGIPIVAVSLSCKQSRPRLLLEQRRYLPLGSASTSDQIWQIPVCFRYEGNEARSCTLMTARTQEIELDAKTCPTWIEANDHSAGYYRVNYGDDLLTRLTKGSESRLNAPERVDLLGNVQALVASGGISEASALRLIPLFHNDSERPVVLAALHLAVNPQQNRIDRDVVPQYAEFLRSNFQARARDLGWVPKEGEPDDARLLRPELLRTIATYGEDRDLARDAQNITGAWLKGEKSIDPSVIAEALSTAAYYGDSSLAERFLAQWKKIDTQQQWPMIRAMATFRDKEAVRILLEAVLSGRLPATPGDFLLFMAGYDGLDTRLEAFEFLQAHFNEVIRILPSEPFPIAGQLPRVGERFCDVGSKKALASLFETHVKDFPGSSRILAQVIETIDQCIAVKKAQQEGLTVFLQKH